MDSLGFAEIKHVCEKGHEFILRQFKGWALLNGKPTEAVVYKDRPACPICGGMEVKPFVEKKPTELAEHPADAVEEPEHEKGRKKK